MRVGFLFWPFTPNLVRELAADAERYGYDLIGIADTPGNAMDPWVAATMVAQATQNVRIGSVSRTSLRGTQRYPPPGSPRSTCLRRVEQSLGSVLAIAARAIWGSRDPARANSPTAPISSAPYWRANRRLGEADKRISRGYASHPQSSSPDQDRGRSPQRAIVRTEFLSITAFWPETSRGPRTRFARLLRRRVARDRISRSGIWPRWTAALRVRCRDSGSEPFSLLWRPVTSSAAI